MRTIILNNTNVVNNGLNDTYVYQFPNGAVNFDEEAIALATITFPFTWNNITSATTGMAYNNNQFSYIWIDGTVVDVEMPDGNYEIATVNAFMQQVMVDKNHYLIDNTIPSDQKFVYYLEIVFNPTRNKTQLNAYPVPTSLPANFLNPGIVFPATPKTPQFDIYSTNNFKTWIGYTAGLYPPTPETIKYSVLGSTYALVQPVNSILISCNLLNNKYSLPSTLLYSFDLGPTRIGGRYSMQVPQFAFVEIQNGQYTNIQIQFLTQDQKRLHLLEPNVSMLFVIMKRQDYYNK